LGSLSVQLSSSASGTTASHTSSSAIEYSPSPWIVTATLPEPLNVNDATTCVPEQPLGWYGDCGANVSVASTVGHHGLITVPFGRAATTAVESGPCIAAATMLMSSGVDMFAQCSVKVLLGVVDTLRPPGSVDVD
jgi:hypothetical protein